MKNNDLNKLAADMNKYIAIKITDAVGALLPLEDKQVWLGGKATDEELARILVNHNIEIKNTTAKAPKHVYKRIDIMKDGKRAARLEFAPKIHSVTPVSEDDNDKLQKTN